MPSLWPQWPGVVWHICSFGLSPPPGVYDIHIEGLGINCLVSKIANTTLKEPRVGQVPPPPLPLCLNVGRMCETSGRPAQPFWRAVFFFPRP